VIFDGESGTGTRFFSEYFDFPLSLSLDLCSIHPSIHPSVVLYKLITCEHHSITHLKTLTATASSSEDAVGKLLNKNVCYGFVTKMYLF
jgi:hypothetical protein